MSRNILESAETYLAEEQSVKIAHLVRLELSTSTDGAKIYIYMTDYMGNITYDSQTYTAGKVLSVGSVRQTQGLTNYKLTVTIAGEFQEELDRGLIDHSSESYVGKSIQVLRAYLDEEGNIIPFDKGTNGPLQYFIGDISDINITEGVTTGNSVVSWQCVGKFADFLKINGRVTDDTAHRGLVVDDFGSIAGSDGAKKVAHQTDRGFQHANQTINVVSKYMTTETQYKLKKRRFWQSSKLVAYEEEVEREVELGVDLSAQFLPKVYGVRKVPGIPVFIDALKDDPSQVYIVYAFSEGEIDSFMNFYLEGTPVICSSSLDSDASVCLGNQANGDTLSAFMSTTSNSELDAIADAKFNTIGQEGVALISPIAPTQAISRTSGTTHTINTDGSNEVVSYFTITNDTGTKEVTAFHGKSNQNACQELVDIASAGNFLMQEEWAKRYAVTNSLDWNTVSDKQQSLEAYWDSNCKLLDTSYVVMKIAISDEETDLPTIDAVVSGSTVSTFDSLGAESTKQYSLNPAWQALAYMRDEVCGGGIPIAELDLESFYYVASSLDTITDSYNNDYVTYWRYIGWKDKPVEQINFGDDPQKTVMQCNTLINTEDTVTSNLQGLLEQFDATLNILGGKYHLSLENADAAIAHIDVSEVVGKIKTTDLSNKNKWNSVQASITDPAVGWGTTQVNFFDSNYLAADNGIKKKGNVQFRHLTNYYTARAWAKIQLAKSRYSRELSFTTYYKYTSLYPNANVTFSYPRFGYTVESPGTFRVKSTTLRQDGLIDLILEDFDPSSYVASLSDDRSGEFTKAAEVLPPTGLEYVPLPDARFTVADSDGTQGILVWDRGLESNVLRYDVRDWLELSIDTGVPYDRVILDSGVLRPYILVSGIVGSVDYKFKVRTIAKSRKGSKYAVLPYSTFSDVSPISFSTVTSFKATNATSGKFDGGSLSMTWDAHIDPQVTAFELEITDPSNNTLRGFTVLSSTLEYTYNLADNIADYAVLNAGEVGAYRSFTLRIRATNGVASSSPNFRFSSWNQLV